MSGHYRLLKYNMMPGDMSSATAREINLMDMTDAIQWAVVDLVLWCVAVLAVLQQCSAIDFALQKGEIAN